VKIEIAAINMTYPVRIMPRFATADLRKSHGIHVR
jgi:hypothetical protein